MSELLIRADASARIGSGHVMRCLALALEWRARGGSATFLSHCESDAIRHRIESSGIDFISIEKPHPDQADLQVTLAMLEQMKPSWLVLDGYHFGSDYQQAVKSSGRLLLIVDDTAHLPYYHADVLLNQNILAERLTYRHDPDVLLLLGTRYALLRPEFLAWRGKRREIPSVARKVLVTMGGDPDNVTLKVVQGLRQVDVDGLEALVVAGASNAHYEELQKTISHSQNNEKSTISLVRDAEEMPELMSWADVAVSGGGSTSWELAFMGLPGIIVTLADNQIEIAKGLDEAGAALNFGWYQQVSARNIAEKLTGLLCNSDLRRAMSWRGRSLVDGSGAARVIEASQSREVLSTEHTHSIFA